jgi:hypothetical protein
MNVFEGSRRIAKVAAGIWVIGFGIAALNVSPVVSVTYHLVLGVTPKLAAECPENGAVGRSKETSTKNGTRVYLTPCFPGFRSPDGNTYTEVPLESSTQDLITLSDEDHAALLRWDLAKISDEGLKRLMSREAGKVVEQSSPAAIAYRQQASENIVPPSEDEPKLDRMWWKNLFEDLAAGLAWMLAGLAALWTFSAGVGWIVRGFLGIPRGHDTKTDA